MQMYQKGSCHILVLPGVLSCLNHFRPFVTPWTVAHQAPLSVGFSRQERWSGLLCLPPGHLLDPGIKPVSLVSLISPALSSGFFITSTTLEAHFGTTEIQ